MLLHKVELTFLNVVQPGQFFWLHSLNRWRFAPKIDYLEEWITPYDTFDQSWILWKDWESAANKLLERAAQSLQERQKYLVAYEPKTMSYKVLRNLHKCSGYNNLSHSVLDGFDWEI